MESVLKKYKDAGIAVILSIVVVIFIYPKLPISVSPKVTQFLEVGGLLFSLIAWFQAKEAKEAAQNASEVVTLQKINNEISEVIHACDIQKDIDIYQVQAIYGNIGTRLMSITLY